MTYAEVNARLVRLMYVAHESRWVDLSLRNLVGDWLRRVEERLSNVNEGSVKVSVLQSYAQLDKPQEFLEKFLEAYPAAKDQILASADVAYFLAITQRPGQKVCFSFHFFFFFFFDVLTLFSFRSPFLSSLFSTRPSAFGSRRFVLFDPVVVWYLEIDLTKRRILSGKPKTSKLSSIKTLNESVSFKDLSPSSSAQQLNNPLVNYWEESNPSSSPNFSSNSTRTTSPKSQLPPTSLLNQLQSTQSCSSRVTSNTLSSLPRLERSTFTISMVSCQRLENG